MKGTDLIIFAGVNGAGKSTLFKMLEGDYGVRLNSDEVVQRNGWDWKDQTCQMKAAKELLREQKRLLEERKSFNRETTLCGNSIVNLINEAHERGYRVELFYVGVASKQIAIDRVKERESKGGHGVRADLIEQRYDNSQENLKTVFNSCDIVHFYDNTVSMKEVCWCKDMKIKCNISSFEWNNSAEILWLKKLISDIYKNAEIDFIG